MIIGIKIKIAKNPKTEPTEILCWFERLRSLTPKPIGIRNPRIEIIWVQKANRKYLKSEAEPNPISGTIKLINCLVKKFIANMTSNHLMVILVKLAGMENLFFMNN